MNYDVNVIERDFDVEDEFAEFAETEDYDFDDDPDEDEEFYDGDNDDYDFYGG